LADSPVAECDLNGIRQTVGSLAGGGASGGRVKLTGGTLIVEQTGASTYNGTIEGPGTFQKSGAGMLVLTGPNAYSGPAMSQAGELRVDGLMAQTTATVLDGGVLSGTGMIGGSVNVQERGSLVAGGPDGTLAIDGTLLLGKASRTYIQLDAALGLGYGIRRLSQVTYGGTLVVQNRAGSLVAGKSFHVFSAAEGKGHFDAIVPGPGLGLAWDFNAQ